jgi:hypothetical protein
MQGHCPLQYNNMMSSCAMYVKRGDSSCHMRVRSRNCVLAALSAARTPQATTCAHSVNLTRRPQPQQRMTCPSMTRSGCSACTSHTQTLMQTRKQQQQPAVAAAWPTQVASTAAGTGPPQHAGRHGKQ